MNTVYNKCHIVDYKGWNALLFYRYSQLQDYFLGSPLIRAFDVPDILTEPFSANKDSAWGLQVSEISCQTNFFLPDLKYTDEEIQDHAVLRRCQTVASITKDDKSARLYTGISYVVLCTIIATTV